MELFLQSFDYFSLYYLELIHICLWVLLDGDILSTVCWNQMIVTMWNFISCKYCTYSLASGGFLNCWWNMFCGWENRRIVWFWYITEMINFTLGNYESVSNFLWKYIKKCISVFIFIDLEGWNLSGDNTRKEWCHNSILLTNNLYCSVKYGSHNTWKWCIYLCAQCINIYTLSLI